MRILYSAFSCNPNRGSEAYCGWSWPLTMCKYNETYVITRPDNKKDIEQYINKNNISNLKVFYCDSRLGRKLKLSSALMFMIYYALWQRDAYKLAKKLHDKYDFDYIHHVSLGDFRLVGKLWKIKSKFIFGPVGGAQITPKVFKDYVKEHKVSENFRRMMNFTLSHNLNYRRAMKNSFIVLAANEETADYIRKRYKKVNLRLLTENGITKQYLQSIPQKESLDGGPINIIWSGRLIYRKGLSFLIDVISLIKNDLNFILSIYGSGEEFGKLKEQVQILGLEDKVKFMGSVPFHTMQFAYRTGDIFAFPSLRETTGTVLFEAMANELAIIALEQNGAKLLVDDSCGILVSIKDRSIEEIKQDFATKLTYLIQNRDECRRMGRSGRKRIEDKFTWEKKINDFKDDILV